MRLFRYTLLAIMCFFYYGSLAQTQQGYVKTLGRPNKKGEALSGVSVRVKGEHNAALSKSDGTFSMLMTGKKNGDAYSLQQVQKTDYELKPAGNGITDLYGLGIDFKKIAIRLLAVYCGFRDICPCIKQGHSFYP